MLAAQTTQDTRQFIEIQHYLEDFLTPLPVLQTICDATQNRQNEALEIAAQVDCMVVVGGHESGNTRRLADLAAATGIRTCHVESVEELEANFFANCACVGLTAGASTPKSLIDALEKHLAKM